MKIATYLLSLGLLAMLPAHAQSSLEQELQRCAAIRNAAERLFCFDSLAAGAETETATGRAPARSQAAPATAGSATAATAASRPAETVAQGSTEDDFGKELQNMREGVQEIRSRYDGTFDGWSGDTVFRLENGQVWKQSESGRLAYKAERPMVTIRRGWFGVYYLKVEGSNKQIRVKRVK